MGDKKTYTDQEFRRLKKLLQAYISQSEWDERMNNKRKRWLFERHSSARIQNRRDKS